MCYGAMRDQRSPAAATLGCGTRHCGAQAPPSAGCGSWLLQCRQKMQGRYQIRGRQQPLVLGTQRQHQDRRMPLRRP